MVVLHGVIMELEARGQARLAHQQQVTPEPVTALAAALFKPSIPGLKEQAEVALVVL